MPPFFEGNGGPYDIDWDEAGNCYIHGGSERNVIAPEIVKMDNKGKKLWTYVLTEFGDGIYNYGDFAVDRQTQSVYVISPSEIKWNEVGLKFDANGMKIATYYRDSLMQELWRIAFNSCTHQAVIGGGGLTRPAHQLCFLDTNFVQMKSLPIRNSMNGADDVWGVAIDNAGSCYIGLGKMNWDEPNYKNVLMKLPLPTLSPPTWIVPSYYEFNEGLSNKIRLTGIGYNGICMSADKLYTYDTYVLKKWNTSNGVMQDSIFIDTAVAQSPMYYAGLAADECDNVLMGFENQVLLKDANRNFSTVFTAPTTLGYIYDISLGRNNILYVCGNAFVAAVQLSLPECKPLITTKQVVHSTCNALGSSAIKVSNGTPPYTYSWNTIPLQTGSTAINLIPGTYVVTITDASCPAKIKKDTVVINGNSELQLITTSISTPCNGGTGTAIVSVSNGTWPYTYSWIPVPGSDSMLTNIPAGTYTVTVTDKNGCIKTATIILNKGSNSPVATISATHITCNGDANGTLTANVTGGTPPYTYLWNTGGTGTMITNLKAGSYYLTVTGADGCSITNSVLLTEPLLMQVVIAVTDELCDNGDATAKVKVTGGVMPYTYLWSTGSTADSISKLKAGNYAVTVKDLNGCIKTVAVTVKNNSVNTPKAAFSCKPRLTDIFNSTIQFLDKSTGAIKWQWSFGDGKTAAVQNPVHTYTESGVFIVSLEIFNALECHSIITDTVTIRPFWSFYIPNSFTPDGDGVNDVFNAKAEGVQDFQMTIFNRWGEQIFVTKSLSIPWDGKGNKGTEIPQDVYLYLVILKDSKGVEHRYTGIVSLIK
jgi:gliding motility-associated-like protein